MPMPDSKDMVKPEPAMNRIVREVRSERTSAWFALKQIYFACIIIGKKGE